MMIDAIQFTPWTVLAGGLLIGIAADAFVLFTGRIMGVSGILSGLLSFRAGDFGWRLAFVGGILASPWLYRIFAQLPQSRIDADWLTLILAGVLTGYGSRLGSGCTSGHGICGLSRLAPRSFAATAVFMLSGFLTVFMVRHVLV